MDRNIDIDTMLDAELSRSLRGNVDRNATALIHALFLSSRSLRGNVDRNTSTTSIRLASSASFPTWERG